MTESLPWRAIKARARDEVGHRGEEQVGAVA
jgi:hypothetical protein